MDLEIKYSKHKDVLPEKLYELQQEGHLTDFTFICSDGVVNGEFYPAFHVHIYCELDKMSGIIWHYIHMMYYV